MPVDFGEVGVDLAGEQQIVEVFFFAGFLEGEDALHNDEQDYAHREQINLSSFVGLSFFNLWSHVSHRATVGFKTVDALVAGKPEVGNLEVELVIDENIFKFQVTVNNSA